MYDLGPCRVVVVRVVLQTDNVSVLVLRVAVPTTVGDLSTAVVQVRVPELGRDWPIAPSPIAEVKLPIVGIGVRHVAWVEPVVAGVVDDDIQDDPEWPRFTVTSEMVCRFDEVDQILLRTKVRV